MKKDKLHNIKSTGFKTPDNYFEDFENTFFENLESKTAIKDIEDDGFTVPKDYFNTVENDILDKIKNEDKPVFSLKTRKTFFYVAGIAASLILLVAIFLNNNAEEEILVDMVESYLENRSLNSYELAQLLYDAEILEEDFTIIDSYYEEENLESYLLENSDIENILE
tara:strand:+ start:434 stop:934 length:501 start_codon:yes stop_codon:yes gene_type:complete